MTDLQIVVCPFCNAELLSGADSVLLKQWKDAEVRYGILGLRLHISSLFWDDATNAV
jgi:hypothetical protein